MIAGPSSYAGRVDRAVADRDPPALAADHGAPQGDPLHVLDFREGFVAEHGRDEHRYPEEGVKRCSKRALAVRDRVAVDQQVGDRDNTRARARANLGHRRQDGDVAGKVRGGINRAVIGTCGTRGGQG